LLDRSNLTGLSVELRLEGAPRAWQLFCDLRMRSSQIDQSYYHAAPTCRRRSPAGLAAQIYSLGTEQGGPRISFEVDRFEEPLAIGIGFEIVMTSLKLLLRFVGEPSQKKDER